MSEQFFINHPNSEIRNLAGTYLTEKYEISPYWAENGTVITDEKGNYVKDLQSVFLFLKLNKVNELITNHLKEFAKAETPEVQKNCMQYYIQLMDIRNQIAGVLGVAVVG